MTRCQPEVAAVGLVAKLATVNGIPVSAIHVYSRRSAFGGTPENICSF
jgi:hypothetical protein